MGIETTARRHFFSTAAAPLLLTIILYTLQHKSSDVLPQTTPQLFAREEEAQCPVDLTSPEACRLARETCADSDSDGLIPYLRLYACAPPPAQPFVLFAMILWLPVLFASMATAAAEFLAVHLEYIVPTIGISENLAGVTIFAFGNGCTDLFATLAAMEANSGSLAISELFGAAAFITTVVLGLITIIQPFTVDPRSFVGDVVWFMIAGSLLVAFLADGQLVLGECLGILGLYIAFALFAIFRPVTRDHSAPPAVLPGSEGFRDEVENEAATENDADDLLVQEEDAASSTNFHSNESDLITIEEAGPVPVVDSDSPYIHSLATRNGNSESESDLALDAQELEDLGLPPAADDNLNTTAGVLLTVDKATDSIWKNFPPIQTWHTQNNAERLLTVFSMPLLFAIGSTIPPRSACKDSGVREAHVASPSRDALDSLRKSWRTRATDILWSLKHRKPPAIRDLAQNWFLCLQLILGPQLFSLVVVSQSLGSSKAFALAVGSSISLIISALLILYAFSTNIDTASSPRDDLVISTLAFTVSLIWIYLTATSAVTLLMTLALIYNIPAALLGATIFAIGQSSNDLVANTAVARRGMPVLAASATFGGPMMNMFIGIGGGGLVQVLKGGAKGVYTFQSSRSLFVSAVNLLLGLGVTLGYAFWNSWRLERGLGIALIGIWAGFTIVNVALTMST